MLLRYPTDEESVRKVSPTEPPTIGMMFDATSFAAREETLSAAHASTV